MKPAWDQLMETYADSTSVLIADVDCTTDVGKEVCSAQSVQGYPTIKYYTAETGKAGKDYAGGRDFTALSEFVERFLAEECDMKTQKSCNEKEIGYIEKMGAKDAEAWGTEAKRLEGLADKGMNEEKRKWLNQRINILEQMLGKKVRRKKSAGWSWYFYVGSLALSTVAVGFVFFCSSGSGSKTEGGEEAKAAPKEGEKTD